MRGVKVVGYKDNMVTLKIGGRLMSYLVDRPQPLRPTDASLLQNAMDSTLMRSLFELSSPPRGLNRIFSRFLDVCRHRSRDPSTYLLGTGIADFIEGAGVEVDIDKKTKALVILKSDVDKIRKGDLK